MTKTRTPAYDRWNLPRQLRRRIPAYAKRLRLPKEHVVDLAITAFFRMCPFDWRNELSVLVEMALEDCFENIEVLTGVGLLEKAHLVVGHRPELSDNPWDLSPQLNILCLAYARYLKISCDQLMHIALRAFFTDPPVHHVEELRELVVVALTHLLEDCNPFAPEVASRIPPPHLANT